MWNVSVLCCGRKFKFLPKFEFENSNFQQTNTRECGIPHVPWRVRRNSVSPCRLPCCSINSCLHLPLDILVIHFIALSQKSCMQAIPHLPPAHILKSALFLLMENQSPSDESLVQWLVTQCTCFVCLYFLMLKMRAIVRYCILLELRRSLASHAMGSSEILMAVVFVVMRLDLSGEL